VGTPCDESALVAGAGRAYGSIAAEPLFRGQNWSGGEIEMAGSVAIAGCGPSFSHERKPFLCDEIGRPATWNYATRHPEIIKAVAAKNLPESGKAGPSSFRSLAHLPCIEPGEK